VLVSVDPFLSFDFLLVDEDEPLVSLLEPVLELPIPEDEPLLLGDEVELPPIVLEPDVSLEPPPVPMLSAGRMSRIVIVSMGASLDPL
jgi:hypothetical protein